eukprot:430790-Amphidinium_carterae.1
MLQPTEPTDKYPVHVVRFMLAGKPYSVAVDEMLPVWTGTMRPYFATYMKEHHMWPLIFEKAFAKLFGSFRSIQSGLGSEAFKAIVQAPVNFVGHQNNRRVDKHTAWEELQEGTRQGYPMVASSESEVFGIAKGHAYAVLDASI